MFESDEMIENLSRKLSQHWEDEGAEAAVALILKLVSQDLEILLVKRVENPSDPWSGQIAFPGGKIDSKDLNIRNTAKRETREETYIDLPRHCRFIGTLEVLRSTVRPELLVKPFIFLLQQKPHIILSDELESYFWVSIRRLLSCKGTAKLPLGEVPAYVIEGKVVWGLTYRIIEKFSKVLGYDAI